MNVQRTVWTAQRLLTHPTWAAAQIREIVEGRREARAGVRPPAAGAISLAEALVAFTGAAPVDAARVLASVPEPRLRKATPLAHNPNASRELVALVYALTRLRRPSLVLETGVAHGFTSAAILAALAENGHGRLVSVDLPHLHPRARDAIGAAIEPAHLERWTLELGPAARVLPRVLRDLPAVDVFVQDASHTVAGQLREFRLVWPRLADGGVLLCDDVREAIDVFATEVGATATYVDQSPKLPIGALQKR